MGLVKKQVLHHCLDKAKEHFKLGDNDKSRDYCDMGIAYVADKKSQGWDGEDLLRSSFPHTIITFVLIHN